MKDLYGLRKEQIEKLIQEGLLDKDILAYPDGTSRLDGEPLYVVAFDTSEERDKAYDVIYGSGNKPSDLEISQAEMLEVLKKCIPADKNILFTHHANQTSEEDLKEIKRKCSEYADFLISFDKRTAKVIINKSGGTASEGSVTHRITIPNKWAKDMGITEDNREVAISYDNQKKEIKISPVCPIKVEKVDDKYRIVQGNARAKAMLKLQGACLAMDIVSGEIVEIPNDDILEGE